MNRAERRRLKRNQESCNATYTLRNEDVTRIKQDAAQEAVYTAFTMMLGLPVIVLHDKYGWARNVFQILWIMCLNCTIVLKKIM